MDLAHKHRGIIFRIVRAALERYALCMQSIPNIEWNPPPKALYKFRSFPSLIGLEGGTLDRARQQREHFYEMACAGHVKLARPASFQDPFDCHAYAVPFSSDAEEYKARVLEGLAKYLEVSGMTPAEQKAFMDDSRKKSVFVQNFLNSAEMAFQHMRTNDMTIYCLCAEATRPAMWAMYADSHKGVCVQFDAQVPPFYLAYEVIYQEEVGKIPVPIDMNDSTHRGYVLQQMLLVKNTDWQHEREYRFIGALAAGHEDVLNKYDTRVEETDLYFPPERALSVCVGALMQDETVDELCAGLAARNCNIPVYRAELSKEEFKLKFRRLV
jgi:hypothetical protein